MLVFYAFILAVVQALTEFLPVSSSGHLVILHKFLDIGMIDALTFDVALHFGTTLALILFFRSQLLKYIKAFVQMFSSFNLANGEQKTVVNLILATIPAALAGFFLEQYIELYFRHLMVVVVALITGGIVIILVEKYAKKKTTFEGLSFLESIVIGCAQALALIPGVSRSGATIITGMLLKLKRDEAAQFSFILSIPIVLGATLKKLLDLDITAVTGSEWSIFAFGVFISFIFGYFVIKYFIRFVQRRSLSIFGYYRIILGLILLLLILL